VAGAGLGGGDRDGGGGGGDRRIGTGAAAAPADGNTGAAGSIQYSGDTDMFAVPLTAGTQHFVDIEGAPTSKGTLTDPYLRGIYNGRATALAGTANDDARVGFNAGAVFTPATTGTYQIAAGGNGSSTGGYRVFARADDFRGAMDTYGPFGAIAPGAAGAAGVVNYAFDRDLFQVALVAGTTYYIDLEGTATGQGSIGDAYISAIHDPSGAALAGLSDDDGGVGANARIAFTAASSGEYTINAGGWGGWTGSNRLFVRPDDFKSTFEGNGTIGSIARAGPPPARSTASATRTSSLSPWPPTTSTASNSAARRPVPAHWPIRSCGASTTLAGRCWRTAQTLFERRAQRHGGVPGHLDRHLLRRRRRL
jgi:hypothetical protein